MLKRIVVSFFGFMLILVLLLWLLPLDNYFPTVFGPGLSVLVIFDEPSPDNKDLDRADALMLRQLLGHFKCSKIELVSTGEYKKGQTRSYDVVFYYGTKPSMPVPSYMIDDLFFRKKTTVWLNSNLDKMVARHSLDGFGFRMVDTSDEHGTNRVLYKEKELWKLDTSTYAVQIINKDKAEVFAWAFTSDKIEGPEVAMRKAEGFYDQEGNAEAKVEEKFTDLPPLPEELDFSKQPPLQPVPIETTMQKGKLPWIVKGGRFWYVASNPISYHIEGGAYLAFCDILHEIFRTNIKENHPAFVRIEDVHAKRDYKGLIAAADMLQSKNIPFHFTLVPVYFNPATEERRYLSTDGPFLEMVRGMIARGGIPILHGYTHQWDGESAVDYEFWTDPVNGHAVSDGPEYISERIIRGLSECFRVGVYPLSWVTPHYVASQVDYGATANFFTTVIARRQPIDVIGSDQFFPYMIEKDMHNQIIIPESLGYVQPKAGRDPKALLRDADNTLVVRDGWASFFFHTFLDQAWLEEVVDGLPELGYHYVSLADYNNKVTIKDVVVMSGVGEVDLTLNGQYLKEFTIKPGGKEVDVSFSFRPITGIVQKFSSTHPGEIAVYQGVYNRPEVTFGSITSFRPFVSGITSPVSIFLLLVGVMIMLAFLAIWIFLLIRKATGEVRETVGKGRK